MKTTITIIGILLILILLKIIPKKPPNWELFYQYECYHDVTYYLIVGPTACETYTKPNTVAVSRELGYDCGDIIYIGEPINKKFIVNDITAYHINNTIDIWYQSVKDIPPELKQSGRLKNTKILFN